MIQAGYKVNKLEVLEILNGSGRKMCKCICDCGSVITLRVDSLINSKSRNAQKSCGCLYRKQKGLSNHRLYNIWSKMKERCYNKNSAKYKNYGGKGVYICEEWLNFISFYEWALLNGYSEKLEIDRLDNSLGYDPSNCKWSTRREQMSNMSRNTEFVGVSYDKTHNKYKASLYFNGKEYRKSFACKKYGKQEAYEMAKQARLQMESDHNIRVVRN